MGSVLQKAEFIISNVNDEKDFDCLSTKCEIHTFITNDVEYYFNMVSFIQDKLSAEQKFHSTNTNQSISGQNRRLLATEMRNSQSAKNKCYNLIIRESNLFLFFCELTEKKWRLQLKDAVPTANY
jgi:hypothetical protein